MSITVNMFIYLSVLTTVFCCLYYYLTRRFSYWKNKNVNGPKPIPFFGNMKSVALRKQHMGMLYNEIYNEYPEEKVVGIYRMASPTLLIRDLDIVKQVMIKDFESFPDRATDFSKKGLGENIFHSDSNTWKHLRTRFSSGFTSSKLKCIFPLLVDRANKLTDYVENVTMKQPEQDIYSLFLKYAVAATMVTVFGLDIDTFNDDDGLFEIIDEDLNTSYWNEMDMILPGILTKYNLSIVSEKTIKFSHQIVEAGLKQRTRTMTDLCNVMDVLRSMKKEGDIDAADQDIHNNKQIAMNITNDLLAAQAWIFYIAGYGNNTLSLTYALYHLARNIDVQERLISEILNVLEKHDNNLTYAAFKEMKYLDMVFEETLRFHPITNGLVRRARQDVKIDGKDLTIDKGTVIVVSPYAIQHDEVHYPNPEKFDPERFLPENVKNRHTCAFLSFGSGRRSCLGSQLGRMQFGICLITFLSKYRVETSDNTISSIEYDPWRLLLTPKQRIRLNIYPRQS